MSLPALIFSLLFGPSSRFARFLVIYPSLSPCCINMTKEVFVERVVTSVVSADTGIVLLHKQINVCPHLREFDDSVVDDQFLDLVQHRLVHRQLTT